MDTPQSGYPHNLSMPLESGYPTIWITHNLSMPLIWIQVPQHTIWIPHNHDAPTKCIPPICPCLQSGYPHNLDRLTIWLPLQSEYLTFWIPLQYKYPHNAIHTPKILVSRRAIAPRTSCAAGSTAWGNKILDTLIARNLKVRMTCVITISL